MATSIVAPDTAINAFQFHASDEALADLRRRIAATNWPDGELVSDASLGVLLATMRKLASYWATEHDWRKVEARLNALPQYTTSIDGVAIHFIHVRSNEPNALPVIVTHGWPGSIIEQLKIIDPLTHPTAHGASASDAFDVVIQSLPVHGFSGKPSETGRDPQRIARAWTELMRRLGYTRFVAQGGDWGNAVTEQMALQQPPELIGIHTNCPRHFRPRSREPSSSANPLRRASQRKSRARGISSTTSGGTFGLRTGDGEPPQTLYALADSPVGLAAWMQPRAAPRSWTERHIPSLSTTTGSPRARASRPGSSRNTFQRRFAPVSGLCVEKEDK